MTAPFIFDAHLDLALNAIEWNRDLRHPLAEIRRLEAHLKDKPDRGRGTVCLPDLLRARGYSGDDIVGILLENFIRFLRAAWP